MQNATDHLTIVPGLHPAPAQRNEWLQRCHASSLSQYIRHSTGPLQPGNLYKTESSQRKRQLNSEPRAIAKELQSASTRLTVTGRLAECQLAQAVSSAAGRRLSVRRFWSSGHGTTGGSFGAWGGVSRGGAWHPAVAGGQAPRAGWLGRVCGRKGPSGGDLDFSHSLQPL
jgi:hypothetical protein